MKSLLFSALLLATFVCNAQLIPCRPRICMVSYGYHDDSQPNAIKTTIQTIKPDILIENTPHGYWGEFNGYVGCHPGDYTPLGIKVFSYIVGGYEGTHYQNSMDNLATNLARIDGIAADGATGVFLDEVNHHPNTSGKAYIQAIYDKCQSLGLKLIINPGVSNFDSWLMDRCDFILTDEQFNGTRNPTPSELPYLDRVLVLAQNVSNANDAAAITLGGRAKGFIYTYPCFEYITIPAYIGAYEAQITQAPTAPVITQNGNTLQSSYQFGNAWYGVTQGIMPNDTNQNFTPFMTGSYYSIVTLDGCPSDTSNIITLTGTSVNSVKNNPSIKLYPNPASTYISLETDQHNQDMTVRIYDLTSRCILSQSVNSNVPIDVSALVNGVYFVSIQAATGSYTQKLIIQR